MTTEQMWKVLEKKMAQMAAADERRTVAIERASEALMHIASALRVVPVKSTRRR